MKRILLVVGALAGLAVSVTAAMAGDTTYADPRGAPNKILYKDVGGGLLAPATVPVDNTGAPLSPATAANQTAAQGTPGSAIPAKGTLVGGKDGSGNFRPLSTDTSGNLNINLPSGGALASNQTAVQGTPGSSVPSTAIAIGGKDSSGNLRILATDTSGQLATHGIQETLTNCSAAITTGGTSQSILAGNTSRLYLYLQNPVSATETAFFSIGGTASTTAGTSFELGPGATLVFQGGVIPTGGVAATAVTTGHKLICWAG